MIAAPVLLYLIVRNAAVGMSPAMAAALPPKNLAPLLRPMTFIAADPRRRVPPQLIATSREAVLAAPLSFEPFFILARVEEQAGHLDRAVALMEEARRRRPNYLLTHLQLLAYYQLARRERDLLAELDFVLQRSEEAKQFVYPELARMMRSAVSRRTLAVLLADGPSWRREFLLAAQRQRLAPGDVLALIGEIRALRPGANVAAERELYIHSLAASGDYRRGRALWLETLPAAERPRHELLFDGAFRGVRARPPFGWQFNDNETGRAQVSQSAADGRFLDVSYFGGANMLFAEQVVTLPAGRYRLRTRAKSGSGVTSGTIFWNVACAPGGARLLRLPLNPVRQTYMTLEATFQVPPGCTAQRLQLAAEPGDVAATVDAQVAGVEIARAN